MPKIAGERHPKVIRRKTDADTFQRVSKSNYKQVVERQLEDTFLSFPEMYFFISIFIQAMNSVAKTGFLVRLDIYKKNML